MASRLDRLVTILETGSTKLIKDTAVNQLADWQKQHPDELFNLLSRVVPYLRHKDWDTRSTAAKALGKIIENTSPYDPNEDEDPTVSMNGGDQTDSAFVKHEPVDDSFLSDDGLFRLETLDLPKILKYGKELLRVAHTVDYGLASLDPQARLTHLKKTLNGRLGLLGRPLGDDEVNVSTEATAGSSHASDATAAGSLASQDGGASSTSGMALEETGLSARQINALKRKRKKEAAKAAQGKGGFGDLSIRRTFPAGSDAADDSPMADGDSSIAIKSEFFNLDRPANVDEATKVVSEFKGPTPMVKSEIETVEELQGSEWPYERLCEFLKLDIFDPQWEIRHGAALGLREILRVHGAGAGRLRGSTRAQNDALNRKWLDDMACRLCCVLMLDRFTDYASDTSVAPIRETVGQTLGSFLKHLPFESVYNIYQILFRMVMQHDIGLDSQVWAVCHGGMVGLRYIVAVRRDLLLQHGTILDGVVRAVMKGLVDEVDDVRSVSAATLIPMAQEFVKLRPDALHKLINIVWSSLSSLGDDLSASTGKIMDLLATLCGFPEVLKAMASLAEQDEENSFALLVPRLYPFLRHTITSVRVAVLKALMTLVDLGKDSLSWIEGRLLRLVFQNILVERDAETLNMSMQLWTALVKSWGNNRDRLATEFAPHVDALMQLALHPVGVSSQGIPMNGALFQKPSGGTYSVPKAGPVSTRKLSDAEGGERAPKRRRRSTKFEEVPVTTHSHDLDGHMMQGDIDIVGMDTLIRSRVSAAKAMGLIMSLVPARYLGAYDEILIPGLNSPYASTQLSACVIIDEFARNRTSLQPENPRYASELLKIIDGVRPPQYRELVIYGQRVRSQCQQLLNLFREHGKVAPHKLPTLAVVVQGEPEAGPTAFSLANADKCVSEDFDRLKKAMAPAQRLIALQQLNEAKQAASLAIEEARSAKDVRDTRIKAAAACALIAVKMLPKKPTPLIKGIMDSIKLEENQLLQSRSAETISRLVQLFTDNGRRAPADKVVQNLVKFSCVEVAETPEFPVHATKTNVVLSMSKEEDRIDHGADAAKFAREARGARITRRGAKEALEILARSFGSELFTTVPSLKEFMEDPLVQAFSGELPPEVRDPESPFGQQVVDAMSIIRTMTPTLHAALHPFVMQQVPLVIKALHSELSVFRYMAAKCMATICSVMTIDGMTALVKQVLPSINNPLDLHFRQGAIEAIYHLIAVMGDSILPYVIFLIVPVLGRMSDSDNDIRLIATTSFATLVKLVPLEAGIPDPPGLSEELLRGRDRERTFIGQLLDPKKVEPFKIPVAINAELRSYQQDGVNWLHFLNKYNLHGILCDDMGLGKTLQTLCIVASDHYARAEEYKKTNAPEVRRLPSLIICPPTLSGHWQQEIKTFAPFLTVTSFVGPPAERRPKVAQFPTTDIVVTSYEVCRNDISLLEDQAWNYIVLDEGHLIKNPKAKITLAVKKLSSNHRLILTGTPIQNNVLELWSLFDFLMPGFLGAEKVFLDRFAKPIAASRFSKASSKEQEAGAIAIEALHKQVLPFLLRRLKEEVLHDLPPKIVQNYYCDPSDLQRKLYQDFSRKQGKMLSEKAGMEDKESRQHIFKALHYMRKLCNAPALVLTPGNRVYDETQQWLAKTSGTSIEDIMHAPKLNALKDLLIDCGIGVEGSDSTDPLYMPIKPHRALIFCQMKEMIDMVANTVLKQLLPSVSYLRLDGAVEASKRQGIVDKFNQDPSYDCLLLTTSVGGLGLNLTGADTVIFVEHDWNPQRDLQAMDRVHRIGQKKTVNVYRLITRGTLEEKILSLQAFKIDVASTVVNQQNAALSSMNTDQILDLFSIGGSDKPSLISDKPKDSIEGREEDMVDDETGEVRTSGTKAWAEELGELWDAEQYDQSFDLDTYLKQL